jgi:hypothetical protein
MLSSAECFEYLAPGSIARPPLTKNVKDGAASSVALQ